MRFASSYCLHPTATEIVKVFVLACPMSLPAENSLEFYPPKLWGLDYHFNVYNKMYVQDILEMEQYPHFTGAFSYKNHPIYKVDVLGVVVKKVENSKCFIYAVDDGTGVILCCCWKDNFYSQTAPSSSLGDLPAVLSQKVTEIQTYVAEASEGYSLGDLIQVKGKLKIFRDKKEVVANIHKKITDPQFQVFRMCELPRLYNHRYDKPFQLPYKVQQALRQHKQGSTSDITSEKSVVCDLKAVIFDYISKSSHIVDLPVSDLLQYSKVKDILLKLNSGQGDSIEKQHSLLFEALTLLEGDGHITRKGNGEITEECFCLLQGDSMEKQHSLLFEALTLLEGDGHVTRRNDRRMLFEVLLHRSKLDKNIMKILLTDAAKPKYSEKGCHYLHILDELHKTLHYSKVKKEALMFCLQKLEAQSDVIRTTHAYYLPYGD